MQSLVMMRVGGSFHCNNVVRAPRMVFIVQSALWMMRMMLGCGFVMLT